MVWAAYPSINGVLWRQYSAREVLSNSLPLVTRPRYAIGGRTSVAAGVVHVIVVGHVLGMLHRCPLEGRGREHQRRRGRERFGAPPPGGGARLIRELQDPTTDCVSVLGGRRGERRSGPKPPIPAPT